MISPSVRSGLRGGYSSDVGVESMRFISDRQLTRLHLKCLKWRDSISLSEINHWTASLRFLGKSLLVASPEEPRLGNV